MDQQLRVTFHVPAFHEIPLLRSHIYVLSRTFPLRPRCKYMGGQERGSLVRAVSYPADTSVHADLHQLSHPSHGRHHAVEGHLLISD